MHKVQMSLVSAMRPAPLNHSKLFFALVWRMVSDLEGTLGRSFAAKTGSSTLRVKTAGVSSAGGVAVGVLFSSTVLYMVSGNWPRQRTSS
jgi:hypothetical protein